MKESLQRFLSTKMFKNLVILTFISLHNISTDAYVHKINNYTTSKKNCILYEYPNKEYCDYYYPSRHIMVEGESDQLLIGWLFILIVGLAICIALQ